MRRYSTGENARYLAWLVAVWSFVFVAGVLLGWLVFGLLRWLF
jgi:hypothetical protein